MEDKPNKKRKASAIEDEVAQIVHRPCVIEEGQPVHMLTRSIKREKTRDMDAKEWVRSKLNRPIPQGPWKDPPEKRLPKKKAIPDCLAARAVVLRFGEDYSKPRYQRQYKPLESYTTIAKKLGVHHKTCCAICNRWKARGTLERKKYNTRPRKLLECQIDWLVSRDVLKEQAAKTMAQRCDIVMEKWGIRMHPGTLWHYYKERKVKYLRPDYHWSTKWSPDELRG